MTNVFTVILFPTKPSSDDYSAFCDGFGDDTSLPRAK